MRTNICVTLVTFVSLFSTAFGRPGQLKQEKYEFQEVHQTYSSASSNDDAVVQTGNARLQIVPEQYHTISWSQQNPNEVTAVAEMFRQNYNQMVAEHNRMMKLQHSNFMTNLFVPVTHQLYHLPHGYSWNDYFGNYMPYVNNQAKELSHQLIHDLQQGRVTQQDLSNPNFFVHQAASELDRAHAQESMTRSEDMQETELQQHHQVVFAQEDFNDDQQQQHIPMFIETNIRQEPYDVHKAQNQYNGVGTSYHHAQSDGVIEFTPTTPKNIEYVYTNSQGAAQGNVQTNYETTVVDRAETNNFHTSYIQSLPPVKFNNINREVNKIEIHTPVSVETDGIVHQSHNEQYKITTSRPQPIQPVQTSTDNYYGSTYDQQPIYDLKFLDSILGTSTQKTGIVISQELATKQENVSSGLSTTPATTTNTNSKGNVMSMLPHKKTNLNYTEMHHKIRQELDKQMKLHAETENNEETHFMGMTSNKEHVKLTYDTVNKEKEARGDQPEFDDDYIYEEMVESEPGIGYYPVNAVSTSTSKKNLYNSTPTTKSDVSQMSSNTSTQIEPLYEASLAPLKTSTPMTSHVNSELPTRARRIEAHHIYEAPLAPLPTPKSNPNPFYSASLAPFPSNTYTATRQPQVNYAKLSEVEDMDQEVQTIQQDGRLIGLADVVQDRNNQEHDVYKPEQFETQTSQDNEEDMQQFEDVQQSLFGVGAHELANLQQLQQAVNRDEKQFPPEQSYRHPKMQHIPTDAEYHEEVTGHVIELTTSVPVIQTTVSKKNWFQRQLAKINLK